MEMKVLVSAKEGSRKGWTSGEQTRQQGKQMVVGRRSLSGQKYMMILKDRPI